jgi:hypothetical protein
LPETGLTGNRFGMRLRPAIPTEAILGALSEAFADRFFTAFWGVRPRRLCIGMLQMFEHMLDQEPVHLVDLDPTTRVLDEADALARFEAAVGDLEIADVVEEIDVRLFR